MTRVLVVDDEPQILRALRINLAARAYDVVTAADGHAALAAAAKAVPDIVPVDLHLTPTEWQLLEQLIRNPGKLVSQRELLLKIWGPRYVDETHDLRQYMAQLRRKLEPDPARPRHLLTEPGMGYRYQP
jgi:two-component system, OmpR family, KDP operon response regulator KdpE